MSFSVPLSGVRVVEFGNLIAAPYATMLLADLGADVVKVEPPTGDLGRHFGPYLGGESVFFLSVNRGKRSIALDLGDEADLELAVSLAGSADVIVTNLRRGALDIKGLGHEAVSLANPAVVYAQISAFAWEGPDADRVGIDVIFQAESGMMSLTGEPGSPPGKTATTIGDYVAGTNTALAVCAALVERSSTGLGRRIDISLRDGLVAVQGGWNAIAFAGDSQPEKMGTASPFLAPNQTFATSDGYVAVAAVSDEHFRRLCSAIDRTDLMDRFSTNQARMDARPALAQTLGEVFAGKPTDEWVTKLTAVGIPVGRVRSLPEVWADPQITHNGLIHELEHPRGGGFRTIGSPIRLDGNQSVTTRPPPTLDQHRSEILDELSRGGPGRPG